MSIQKLRLIYDRSFAMIFDYTMAYLIGLFPVIAFSLSLIAQPDNLPAISLVFYTACFLFDVWMIINLYLLKALVKIDIGDIANKDNIENALNQFYDNLKFEEISENVFQYEKPSSFLKGWYGKVVTVLVDDYIIYLNVTSLGRGDTPSAIHGLYNYLKCKKIAKQMAIVPNHSL